MSPFSLGTVRISHSNRSTYSTFPHETVFLSKLYPIRQNICTSNHRAEYSTFKSSVYFKKFRHPKTVNSTLLLCFFKYILQTSNNKQVKNSITNPGKQSDLDRQGNPRNLMLYQKSRSFFVLWEITIHHVSSAAGIPSGE